MRSAAVWRCMTVLLLSVLTGCSTPPVPVQKTVITVTVWSDCHRQRDLSKVWRADACWCGALPGSNGFVRRYRPLVEERAL